MGSAERPSQRLSRRRLPWVIGIAALVVTAGLAVRLAPAFIRSDGAGDVTPQAEAGGTSLRPFAASSPWNAPIPFDPVLDTNSDAIVGHIGAEPAIADLYEFGVPIYESDSTTPKWDVECLEDWGKCRLEEQPVPIPRHAQPATGSDGAMVVIDPTNDVVYEFWRARFTGDSWTASWGDVSSLQGDGHGASAVGAGVSRLAGLVRTDEIRDGQIQHAMVLSTDNACADSYRYPASKSDGHSSAPDCIPQGARIQLDPSVDVNAIPGITPAEKTIARALQIYGAYVIDNGAAPQAYGFENPIGKADPYPAAGLEWDYFAMSHIPWTELRVLRKWDGH